MKKLFILFACACVALCGCIDRDFNIADVSGEVTVGGEELVLPLASIDKITLDQLLAENEMIKPGDDGVYTIMFSSFGDDPTKYEKLTVEGVSIPDITGLSPELEPFSFSMPQLPATLNMPGINKSTKINYPTIKDAVNVEEINIQQEISLGLPLSGMGTLNEATAAMIPALTFSHSDELSWDADITIVDGIKYIDFVEFGCDIHPFGAPIEVDLDLRGIANISGGGTLDVRVEFPAGYYLRDKDGNDLPEATHNIINQSLTLNKKQGTAKVLVYLHKIDYGHKELVGGKLEIHDKFQYYLDLNLSATSGDYDMSKTPIFSVSSAPEYKDVEVVVNHFDIAPVSTPISYAFDGLSSSVAVEKIAFESAPMRITMSGLNWLSANAGVRMSFPSCMHFGNINGASMLNNDENSILTTIRDLEQGITLDLLYIDCTDPSCRQENSRLVLNGEITAALDLTLLDGHVVLLSELTPPTSEVTISVNVDETILALDTTNSVVKVVGENVFDFKFEENVPSLSEVVEVPSVIADIDEVKICKAGSTTEEPVGLDFSVAAHNGRFPVGALDLNLTVNLGKMLRPTKATLDSGLITVAENGDNLLTIVKRWDTSTTLSQRLEFEALQNLPNIVDGKIAINQSFPVTGTVSIASGETVDLSKTSEAAVDIDIKVDDITMSSFTGSLNLEVAPEPMVVELGDLGDLGVHVGAMTLNPIIKLNLNNPSGVAFRADAVLKLCDKDGKVTSTIAVPTIDIAGTGMTNLVISTPKNAPAEPTDGATFVSVPELATILQGGFPSKILFELKAATDTTKSYTIDLTEAANGYDIEYQYEVIIPLTFDGDLNLSYESSITGLNETFANLASQAAGLTINDVNLLVEFGSNIPFNIILSAYLINKDGTTENIDAMLDLKECVIDGYTPEYGEKRTSNIVIHFDLGETKTLEGLKNVDGIRFNFSLYDTGVGSSSLSKNQFLDGTVKLCVRDGLSIDIFELLNIEKEE